MENQYMALSKQILELNIQTDSVYKSIQSFKDNYGNSDAKRE